MKPKKKKIIIPGLPGYVDPAKVQKTILEKAHDKLLLPVPKDEEEKKGPKHGLNKNMLSALKD